MIGVSLSCLIVFLSFYTLNQIRQETASSTRKSLNALLFTVQESYHTLISQRKLHASILADNPLVQSLTISLLEERNQNKASINSPALAKLRSMLAPELAKNGDKGFFVIGPDHINIASMRDSNLGQVNLMHLSKPTLLEKAFTGSPAFVPTISSDVPLLDEDNILGNHSPTMFILSPIRSPSNHESIIAVLALRIDAKTHFSNLTGLGRIGDTGETYAFDKNGYMLSESRFIDQLVSTSLIQPGQTNVLTMRVADPGGNLLKNHLSSLPNVDGPLTLMANNAITIGQGDNITGYRDYRGVDVIGVWTWDKAFNFGLASEIDLDEVLESYHRMRTVFIATNLLVLLMIVWYIRTQIYSKERLLLAQTDLASQVAHRTQDLNSAKNELAKINEHLAHAQAAAKLGNWLLVHSSREVTWSREIYRFFNVEPGSLPPKPKEFLKLIHPDDRDMYRQFSADARKRNVDYSIDIRVPQPDGLNLWLELKIETSFGENDLPISSRGIAQDITARKHTEQELLTARILLDESQSVAKVGGWELNIATGSLFWTAETYHIHDTSPDEFNPSVDAGVSYFLPDSRKIISNAIDDAVNNCKDYDLQLETYTTKGRKIHIRTTCKVTQDEGKATKLTGIFQDITQQKLDEEAMLRSSKMDAVGQIAGGIAHDFNNLLNVIIGNLELLEIETPNTKKATKRINQIKDASQRAADVTKQLLSFSRNETSQNNTVSVNDLIIGMDSLISRSVTPEVSVNLFLAEDLAFAKINAGELEGALLNLVINARDAMPGGGELILRTNNCFLDSIDCKQNPRIQPGKYVLITIQDNGQGIAKENIDHIFEPFYTTKPSDKGTGLGLAMVFGAMNRCNGYVEMSTEIGKGTTFELYIPQCEQELLPPKDDTSEIILFESNKTILVVEDEEELLEIAQEFLKIMGYTVVTATNGAEALAQLQKVPEISIVFSDVLMPGGINGYELVKQALTLHPHLKIVLTSGYVDESASSDAESYGGTLLMKPYTQSDLARHISTHLGN